MKISRAMTLAAFITAAVLVVAGSVISTVIAKRDTAAREAEYQQLIDQANQQIEKANAQLMQVQSQMAQPTAQTVAAIVPGEGAPAGAAVSVQQAAEIAQKATSPDQSVQKAPELVDFQGKTAYEVVFDSGSVYVDAGTGEVLFNGTVPLKIDADMAAKVASDYLGDKNVLSVDQITFRGQPLFRVIFKSGTMVYLDDSGQITYINKGMIAALDAGSGDDGGGSSGRHFSDDHHDDHDEHDDD